MINLLYIILSSYIVSEKCSGDIQVSNREDLSKVINCTELEGDLKIKGVEGDLALNTLTKVTGNIVINENDNLKQISLASLSTIGKSLEIKDNRHLVLSAFPALKQVIKIDYRNNHELAEINFPALTSVHDVHISNNIIEKLEWLNLEQYGNLYIEGNPKLKELTLPNLKKILGTLQIIANHDFKLAGPKLQTVGENLVVKHAEKIEFPVLQSVHAEAEISYCAIQTLELPELSSIGGTLHIISNPNLEKLNYSLTSVGGIFIRANEKLKSITAPNLVQIRNELTIGGELLELNFEKLNMVGGLFRLESNGFNCTTVESYRPLTKGTFVCGPPEEVKEPEVPKPIPDESKNQDQGKDHQGHRDDKNAVVKDDNKNSTVSNAGQNNGPLSLVAVLTSFFLF